MCPEFLEYGVCKHDGDCESNRERYYGEDDDLDFLKESNEAP